MKTYPIKKLSDIGKVDQLYSKSRRTLFRCQDWRGGADRVHMVFTQAFEALSQYSTIVNKFYMDLGCGIYNPLGVCTAMYLNGAKRGIAFDVGFPDTRRTAEALYDLLSDCATQPDKWLLSNISRNDFLSKIYRFDIEALKYGDLSAGIKNVNLSIIIGDIEHCPLESESIDFVSSRSVLEHLLNFPKALSELFRVMSAKAVSFHHIDFKDHRIYSSPKDYKWWSFMTELNDQHNHTCNLLRYSQVKNFACLSGFKFAQLHKTNRDLPAQVKSQLLPNYALMSEEDLTTTSCSVIFQK